MQVINSSKIDDGGVKQSVYDICARESNLMLVPDDYNMLLLRKMMFNRRKSKYKFRDENKSMSKGKEEKKTAQNENRMTFDGLDSVVVVNPLSACKILSTIACHGDTMKATNKVAVTRCTLSTAT